MSQRRIALGDAIWKRMVEQIEQLEREHPDLIESEQIRGNLPGSLTLLVSIPYTTAGPFEVVRGVRLKVVPDNNQVQAIYRLPNGSMGSAATRVPLDEYTDDWLEEVVLALANVDGWDDKHMAGHPIKGKPDPM